MQMVQSMMENGSMISQETKDKLLTPIKINIREIL